MFKKILVCLDGSKLAEQILPYAVEQARRFDGELVLFRVIPVHSIITPEMPGIPGIPIDTKGGERHAVEDEKEAEKYLKSLAEKLQAEDGLAAGYDTVLGTAGPAIIEYCRENGIELVAVATHGRSGPGRVILGSVAEYILRHLHVPVLLIRPAEDKAK